MWVIGPYLAWVAVNEALFWVGCDGCGIILGVKGWLGLYGALFWVGGGDWGGGFFWGGGGGGEKFWGGGGGGLGSVRVGALFDNAQF